MFKLWKGKEPEPNEDDVLYISSPHNRILRSMSLPKFCPGRRSRSFMSGVKIGTGHQPAINGTSSR